MPTFNGGLVAAWAVSASLFAMLTYLVIYIQNVLGYSAVEAGVRFLPLTGADVLIAGIAGRLTTRVPIRYLIGGGFASVTGGMLLMRGLTPIGSWTHFLPGFILAGTGAGFINVPLASTAVGGGDAGTCGNGFGVNSTLRQVGIATGVAAFGTILASQIRSKSSPTSAVDRSPATRTAGDRDRSGASPAIAGAPHNRSMLVASVGELCAWPQHDRVGRRRVAFAAWS